MSAYAATADTGLENMDLEGDVPESRIKDAATMVNIYHAFCKADEGKAVQRARTQAMFDGQAPYDEAELRRNNMANRCNLNWGEAAEQLEQATSAYIDMLSSVDNLLSLKLKKDYGDEATRTEWSNGLAHEISQTIREWEDFDTSFVLNAQNMVGHGVGVCYHEDVIDWRWKTTHLGDFKIPHKTRASENSIEVAFLRQDYLPHELYNFIRNEKAAEAMGWDVAAVKRAIVSAKKDRNRTITNEYDWEAYQEEVKDNDFSGYSDSKKIRVIHSWVREFSGKVSHYMVAPEAHSQAGSNAGNNQQEFLRVHKDKYKNMNEAFCIFTWGVGTNGNYHSIDGLGVKIYPMIQESNRTQCDLIDGAKMAAGVTVQPTTSNQLETLSVINAGPLTVLPPGLELTKGNLPNFSTNVIPVLDQMAQKLQRRTGQYTTGNLFNDRQERTRFEAAAILDQATRLNSTMLNLFYRPFTRLLKEVVRRMMNPNYHRKLPGGDAIADLIERLELRGIPAEALQHIDLRSVKAVRAVGGGSASARRAVLDSVATKYARLDQVGQHNLTRDQVAADVGDYDTADRYIGETEKRIPAHDAKTAELENYHLLDGDPISVKDGEFHMTHLEVHTQKINQMLQQYETGERDLVELAPPMVLLHEHSAVHLDQADGDPATAPQVAAYRQALQQAGEIIHNGLREIAKIKKEEGQAAEGEPAEQGQGQDMGLSKLQAQVIETNAKIRRDEEIHRQKMRHREEMHAQKKAQNDVDFSSEIDKALSV